MFNVLYIGILQSLYGSGSKGARSSGGSFCSAAAANALASVVVRPVTRVKLQVARGSVSTCFVARSILGFSIPSMGIILFTKGSEVDARASKASAKVFSPLEILTSSKHSNYRDKSFTSSRYASIRSSLASYSPWNWLVTSWESLCAFIALIPMPKASLMPARRASYSDSLLEALNPSRNDCSITSPVGEVNCILTPEPCRFHDPSIWRCHCLLWLASFRSVAKNSIIKSAKTCAFRLVLVWYSI